MFNYRKHGLWWLLSVFSMPEIHYWYPDIPCLPDGNLILYGTSLAGERHTGKFGGNLKSINREMHDT